MSESGIEPTAELLSAIKTAKQTESFRLLKVIIKDFSSLEIVEKISSVGDSKSDFAFVRKYSKPDEGCFFLYKVDTNPQKWILITYVPEGQLAVKMRMCMASSQAKLRSSFGEEKITADLHVTDQNDLVWETYKPSSTIARSEMLSKREQHIAEARSAEETARKEQMDAIGKIGENKEGGIGGFHTVDLPFKSDAEDAVRKLHAEGTDGYNWVELKISDRKNFIELALATTVPAPTQGDRVLDSDCRFYLLKSGQTPVFMFSCPAAAPRPLKMVYSTAKPGAIKTCQALLNTTKLKKGECFEHSEFAEKVQDALAARGHGQDHRATSTPSYATRGAVCSPSRGGNPWGVKLRTTGSPHGATSSACTAKRPAGGVNIVSPTSKEGSLASFMASSQPNGHKVLPTSTKKKIVVPPKGAYC
eukprot:GCRY01003180.1.p1 GENE.GCRY01003180.1~~GCRY01003180.1.p1  ORF type:complete len:418 (-),score=86.83 GCRY01003180.1:394-1647(-)